MVNNSSLRKWHRLQQKQLGQQFIHQVCDGCRCSPFEAQAILQTVYSVFSPFFDNAASLKPGQIQLPVISIEGRQSQSLAEAPLVTVTLTLSNDAEDLPIRERHGVVGLRRHRLQRICREALQQDGLLTVEDLANRIFNCGERTVCRDIQALKKQGITLPLRSTVKDMGRTLSHRCDIVRLWLLGKEYSQIARDSFHSVPSVQNYVGKFKRVVALTLEGFDAFTIAFLVRISSSLVKHYQELYQTLDIVPHRKEELSNMSKKTILLNP
jgi:DNA-binding CsgD family transcriptional regulator